MISDIEIKKFISSIGYLPEDGVDNIYYKKYSQYGDYTIRVNFNTSKIEYRESSVNAQNGIQWGDSTTSNFKNSENFVVLECINRLLEKGYAPKSIYLEYKFPLGKNEKGKLDILVFDNNDKAYLMIECKTWGTEFTKEEKKMLKDGGQLFSYYIQDKGTQYLCLYTSRLNDSEVEYKNNIIKADEAWSELNNQKEIYDHWNKNTKDNGIFEEWANAYNIEIKALVRGRLLPLTKDDSGRIFNQFAEILRHNVVSDKPNAFNKILNLFICKIIDEDKNDAEQVEFQWLEDDTDESLQIRLNDLYKKGMHRFLDIDVTDFTENDIASTLVNIGDSDAQKAIKDMFVKLRLQKNPEFAFIEVYDDTSFKLNARVVREVVELLQPYQFRYGHKQQFLGDFFELLLSTSIKQEAGQYFTPVPITRYIISSLPIKEIIEDKLKANDADMLPSVIDFACGTGHFLTEYMDKVQSIIENEIDIDKAKPIARKKLRGWIDYDKFGWAGDYVYGIDADYRLIKSSKVSSFLNGDGEANIIRANGLDNFGKSKEYKGKLKITSNEDPKDNAQFDILIANPPYSVNSFKSTVKNGEESFELFNSFTDKSSEIECLFIERMKQLLKIGGYAGIILPSSILSNSGVCMSAREIILKYFKIVAITEFGSNTFMATNTNTVALFLKRRPNTDYKHIQKAINDFFEKPKEVTVLGIEKAFSKYVSTVFDGIKLEDYISFISRQPNSVFINQEAYEDYCSWFHKQNDIKKLIDSKKFKEKTIDEQQQELKKLFYDKVLKVEKKKILFFLLSYGQKTVITKSGKKQAEKDFLGYEFSNSRGKEGIKMLSTGTMLYDETDKFNPEKANYYVYRAFLEEYGTIEACLAKNIVTMDTITLIDFSVVQFETVINIGTKQPNIKSKYKKEKLGKHIISKSGNTFPKGFQGGTDVRNIPFFKVSDMNMAENWKVMQIANNYVDLETISNELSATIFEKGNIIFPKVGMAIHTNKKRILGRDSCIDNNIMSIGVLDNTVLDNQYLYEIFKYYIQLGCFSSAANPPTILTDKLLDFKIPIPPINIQHKIVSKIASIEESETKVIDKSIKCRDLLRNSEWFSYGTERIEKLAVLVQRGKSTTYGTSNVQIIKSGQARGYNEFDFSKRYYVSDNFVSDDRNLQRGDILINSTGIGTAGRVTLFNLKGEYVVDSHITIVRLNKEIVIPKYALYALANIGFKNIESMANGQSGQIELALPTINAIRIPLPSMDRQREIVNRIEDIEKEIQSLEIEMADAEEEKKNILIKYLND